MVSIALCLTVYVSLLYLLMLCLQNHKHTDTHKRTHALTHTARGCIQTTMVERTRGDGLLTDRVQAVCVTLGG